MYDIHLDWNERVWNPDLCVTRAELYHFSYEANWELVIMWVDDKPTDD